MSVHLQKAAGMIKEKYFGSYDIIDYFIDPSPGSQSAAALLGCRRGCREPDRFRT